MAPPLPSPAQHLPGTSQSWSSPAALQSAKFTRLQNNAGHLGFSQSPFFPKTAAEFGKHAREYQNDVMEREKEKLGRKIEEREVRRRLESEARREREVLREMYMGGGDGEEVVEQMGKMDVHGEGEEGGVGLHGETEHEHEQALAGKAKEVKVEVTQIDEDEIESSEQIDNPSPADGTTTPTKRERTRGKRSKGENKIESQESTTPSNKNSKENIQPATPTSTPKSTPASKKSTAAASLLGSMANDSLLKGVFDGTARPPNSSLWKAFSQSPLYSPSGSAPALNAMFASLQKPGYTTVLGEKTSIWAGDEHLKPEGRRDTITLEQRSAWPEMSEMKAEGQYRKDTGKDRRLPLPRMDLMTCEAVVREAGGIEKVKAMGQEEKDAICRELEKKTGDEIAWMDRQPVRYWGIDRLESVSKERREENTRRRKGEPVCGPSSHGAAMGEQRRGPNMGLRGGFHQSGVGGRRQTGAPPLVPPPLRPKPVDPVAMSYSADGPGDGMNPPAGGWVFDEEFLQQKGDWQDLLDKHL